MATRGHGDESESSDDCGSFVKSLIFLFPDSEPETEPNSPADHLNEPKTFQWAQRYADKLGLSTMKDFLRNVKLNIAEGCAGAATGTYAMSSYGTISEKSVRGPCQKGHMSKPGSCAEHRRGGEQSYPPFDSPHGGLADRETIQQLMAYNRAVLSDLGREPIYPPPSQDEGGWQVFGGTQETCEEHEERAWATTIWGITVLQ